jgi:heparin binding hemagglutinin HbhA
MALVADIRKNVIDTTPVFAAVGLTDLAVEKVRNARVKATAVRVGLDPAALQTKAQARVTEVAEQAQELPALTLNRSLELASKAQDTYETVAARGEKLVKRVRTQKSTKDLLAQAEATFALGKGAVTTVRKSATDIQRSAKATLTTGRKEAAVAADVIADSVVEEATGATSTVKQSATRTRTAAKRTSTTTKNAAAKSKSATKGATTSARKTATATKKAGTTAATKVGA